MKNNRIKVSALYLFFTLLIGVTVYWRWFLIPGIYSWGDWGYHYRETVLEWFQTPQVWYSASLGGVDIGLALYITARFFYSLFAHTMDSIWFDKLVFIYPTVIVPLISVFLLVKQITKNNIAAVIGSLVYSFSTYVLTINTGHYTLAISYAFGPLVFLAYRKAILERSLFYSILAGVLGLMASAYEVRGFYLTALILLAYYLYNVIPVIKANFKDAIVLSVYAAIPVALVGLMNLYWILGFMQTSAAYSGFVLDRPIFGRTNQLIFTVFSLFHPSWTGSSKFSWGVAQSIPLYFWIIPYIAFTGYWWNRKNKDVIFWVIIGLIGVFLTKIGGEPFSKVYEWLYYNLPGFGAFRESSKFNYFVVLSYSVIIGCFVSTIWKHQYSQKSKWILTLFVTALFAVNTIPVFRGELAHLLKLRHIPNDYLILKSYIQKQDQFFRILYVTAESRWGYWDSSHPKIGTNLAILSEWRELNNYHKAGLEYSPYDEIIGIFQKPNSDKLLDFSSIKYVIVPPEDKENEESFIYPHDFGPQDYVASLDKLPYLQKIDIGTKELVIYENKEVRDHIFSSDNEVINYKRYSPSHFEITLKAYKDSTIYFNEGYHSGWKIRVGDFSWWRSLLDKNYFLEDSVHEKNIYNLNTFHIPALPEKNNTITIYFAPQSLVNIGTIVSLTTLLLSIFILWKTRKQL